MTFNRYLLIVGIICYSCTWVVCNLADHICAPDNKCVWPYYFRLSNFKTDTNCIHGREAWNPSGTLAQCYKECMLDVCCLSFELSDDGTCVKYNVQTDVHLFVKVTPKRSITCGKRKL